MLTDKNLEDLLAAVEHTGLVRKAARTLGLNWHDVKEYIKNNPDFEAELTDHMELFGELVEQTIIERALKGTETPVYDKNGNHVRNDYIPNDSLLVRLAQARMPEKYGNKTEISSKNGQPITVVYNTGVDDV